MLLRLQKYNLRVTYTRGSELYIADTMPGATCTPANRDRDVCTEYIFTFEDEIAQINEAELVPKVSQHRLKHIKDLTNRDDVLLTLKSVILTGWSDSRDEVPVAVRDHLNIRDELTVQDGIIYKSSGVVIPKLMRPEMLTRIYSSHLGSEACLRKALDSLSWPNMSSEIKNYISQCARCFDLQNNQDKEPLISHEVPGQN